MEALRVIAESWPIAVMFGFACLTFVVLRIKRAFETANDRDLAYKASQAREVSTYKGNQND